MSFKNCIFEKNPPASEEEIKKIEKQLNLKQPKKLKKPLNKVKKLTLFFFIIKKNCVIIILVII